jgi:hypothetical protein
MQVKKPCPFVSYSFLMFFNLANHYQVPTWQLSSNSAVTMCGTSRKYKKPKNLAAVVPGHISGIVLLGLFRGKGTPGMFDPVL